ncbi:GntR family transcriptional regulator [Novosphingobium nitrogenifigens DSM 19370]|uniref:GntR family transcriptional regulator n=1 Tax=Novosphingobium nitrogenifigens DSM 19370 TaxID=983920 RepID=F1ZD43_9SPHN|nr:GntR family transcriptional regulator [Novosphingobium nitrogenifigens]EGD57470.1 GntR family transcriptional regulator [Novosphingobium nitrogenifigens DSM 19370]
MSDLAAVDHVTLSDTVYRSLCDALIAGQFQPGERLKIRDLADQLGTSVTPVRDAILRLTTDEALVFRSARDIRIPIMNEARYLEIRTIRLRLEAIAAEAAAQIATPRDLDAIGALVSENALALKAQDYARCTELNQQFHFLLPTIARLPVLHGILRRLWLQMGPTIAHSYPAGGSSMVDWHYPVLEALRKRDSTAAAQAIMDDIYHGGLTILSHVQKRATVPA